MPLVSRATVNRTSTLVLKNLFGRAKRVWRYSFPQEPVWRDHILKEPKERVRELHDHEGEALRQAIRADYAPWLEFASLTGLRRSETLLRWSEVNWSAGQIIVRGKGDTLATTPITPTIRALLEPLIEHHNVYVFNYVATKTRDGKVRGKRYPITDAGAKTQWRRAQEKAGLANFRFHDLRHDVGTKLLRSTGNLKLVAQALNHRDLKSTMRYAHVSNNEVAFALEALSGARTKPLPKSLPSYSSSEQRTDND